MRLDIGAGLALKEPLCEWTHLDCNTAPHIELVCNWADIPLGDGEVYEIWLGDVVEHVPLWEQDRVFTEWNRILRPGGIIGGKTPNLDYIARAYARGEMNIDWALVPNLYGWTDRPTEQHYITYTQETLTSTLAAHGFDINDYSGSPGRSGGLWWLVFRGTKV